MPTSPLILQGLWDRALEEEIGIKFEVEGMPKDQFVNELYAFRSKAMNARYEEITLCQPNDGKVWLVKKATEIKLP